MAEFGSGGALAARVCRQAGISHLFTLNGSHLWPLYAGAVEQELRVVDVRHEQTAAFAAEGWAKLSRRPGLVAATAGPGVTNTISAVANARANDSPVLLLGGRAPDARWGQGSLQEIDQVPLLAPVTKSAATVHAPGEVGAAVGAALAACRGGRTGPVFLDLPLDVVFGTAPAELPALPEPVPPLPPDPGVVARVADLVRHAERPAVLAGSTVWWGHAEAELRRLAETASLPVLLNGLARGVLAPDHPQFATRARSLALAQADVVLVVGAPLDFRLGFGQSPPFASGARIVLVDVDDAHRHAAAAEFVWGDVASSLRLLAGELEGLAPREDWLQALRERSRRAQVEDDALASADDAPIHPLRLLREVEDYCAEDAVLVGDGGDFVSFAGRVIHRREPGLWMDVGPFGCLGSGPGYALAAQLLHPGRQVVLLSGDGAFGFAGLEVDTFVRHGLPIVTIVGNNGGWALEKHSMRHFVGVDVATDLRPGTRYDQVVTALGGHGELVQKAEEIRPALDRAFASGLPACLNVLIDPEAEYPRAAMLM